MCANVNVRVQNEHYFSRLVQRWKIVGKPSLPKKILETTIDLRAKKRQVVRDIQGKVNGFRVTRHTKNFPRTINLILIQDEIFSPAAEREEQIFARLSQ